MRDRGGARESRSTYASAVARFAKLTGLPCTYPAGEQGTPVLSTPGFKRDALILPSIAVHATEPRRYLGVEGEDDF